MRTFIRALFVVLLAGCASDKPEDDRRPPGGPGRPSAEAVREYIDKVKPAAAHMVYYKRPLRLR